MKIKKQILLGLITIVCISSLFPVVNVKANGDTVDFEANKTIITKGTTVNFEYIGNFTVYNSSWFWDFGDGNYLNVLCPEWPTEEAKNPSHEYASLGWYDVTLEISSIYGDGNVTKENYIKVIPDKIILPPWIPPFPWLF